MRLVAKICAAAIGAIILVFGGAFALIESGEVVVLRALPDEGHDFIARLWVVDYDTTPWVGKADSSRARWVARLRSNPRVELARGGVADCREAVPLEEPTARREIYALYQSKYRVPLYGSRLLGVLFGSNPDPAEMERSGVLFRLRPCTPERPAPPALP